jgi:transcription elongation factor Elf1
MDEESGENYKIIQNFYDMRHNRRETSIRKKHIRRCAKELKKDFPCLYNCGKEYATDAARNMHMRTKHNEVTKTERDRKARDIIRNCGLKNNTEIVQKLSMLTKQ